MQYFFVLLNTTCSCSIVFIHTTHVLCVANAAKLHTNCRYTHAHILSSLSSVLSAPVAMRIHHNLQCVDKKQSRIHQTKPQANKNAPIQYALIRITENMWNSWTIWACMAERSIRSQINRDRRPRYRMLRTFISCNCKICKWPPSDHHISSHLGRFSFSQTLDIIEGLSS